MLEEGRIRAVIDALLPVLDGGRFPVKRIAGEPVRIEAHCLADGHDKLAVVLQWQLLDAAAEDATRVYEVRMTAGGDGVEHGVHARRAGAIPLQRPRVGRSFRVLARRTRAAR